MRGVLILGLMAMSWSAAADAATAHRPRMRQHIVVHPSQDVAAPGWPSFPGYPPLPPGENRNLDPSTRGSG